LLSMMDFIIESNTSVFPVPDPPLIGLD
jgi:hypothetical protein